MRHEKLPIYKADIAPMDEISVLLDVPSERSENVPKDTATMHPGVFKSLIGLFAGIMAIFALTFAGKGYASMMVAISIFYLGIYIATPLIMLRPLNSKTRKNTSWVKFMNGSIETNTGLITGRQALIQVCLIPVGLLVAVMGICMTILLVR
jgi:hypothetical protein